MLKHIVGKGSFFFLTKLTGTNAFLRLSRWPSWWIFSANQRWMFQIYWSANGHIQNYDKHFLVCASMDPFRLLMLSVENLLMSDVMCRIFHLTCETCHVPLLGPSSWTTGRASCSFSQTVRINFTCLNLCSFCTQLNLKLISSALGCSNCAYNTRWSLIRCTVPWGWVKQPSWLWSTWTLWRTTRPAQCVTTRICANSCPRRTDGVWFKHHGIVAVTMEVKSPLVSTKSHRVSVWQTSMQWTKQPNDYSCSWSWQFDSMPDVRC